MIESAVERLAKTHPDLEIWWDSSPLVYKPWAKKMIDAATPARRPALEEQLGRLYNAQDPAQSLARGCTTNPPLSWQAVQADPQFWARWIDEQIRQYPRASIEELTWMTYKEVVKKGA